MKNFTYNIPTIVHFGRGQISKLCELTYSGRSVLLVYGGGSIKNNGIYDRAIEILAENKMSVYELPGVEPNPRIQLVRKGVEICREKSIDMVLAIGGGSSIDCAKLVAAGACYEGDAWDLMLDCSKITNALPIYCVLTLAATGSEMDNSTVISDPTIQTKLDINADAILPVMAILDPEYTFTVSARQTAAGAVDIMSHVFESYFIREKGATVQEHLCEAILKTVIQYAPIALEEPDNYDARANLMWSSSLALNGILTYGGGIKWCVHPMEHELSAYYDITHGVGLAILTPVWMRYVLSKETAPQFAAYGRNVWNLSLEEDDLTVAEKAICKTEAFFAELGMPLHLSELEIGDENFEIMAEKCLPFCKGCYVPLTKEDIVNIYCNAL